MRVFIQGEQVYPAPYDSLGWYAIFHPESSSAFSELMNDEQLDEMMQTPDGKLCGIAGPFHTKAEADSCLERKGVL